MRKKTLLNTIFLLALFFLVSQTQFLFAQSRTNPTGAHWCGGDTGIETAIGCLSINDTNQFILTILKFALGVGGGIAFLLMIVGVFQITTSSGNPDRLKAGQELITSAIIGLLMLVFSVFLLKLIGVDILGIPGFSI